MIAVNDRHIPYDSELVSYEQILKMAGFPIGARVKVAYEKGKNNAEGTLSRYESVEVNTMGMRFNAYLMETERYTWKELASH